MPSLNGTLVHAILPEGSGYVLLKLRLYCPDRLQCVSSAARGQVELGVRYSGGPRHMGVEKQLKACIVGRIERVGTFKEDLEILGLLA